MIKSYIEKSHQRSKCYNIEREMVFSKTILNSKKLQIKLNEKKEFIVTAMPFINELYNFVKGSNFFVILTDEEGCILSVVGDENILSEAHDLKMIPGAYMDEKNMGTNAMGTALAERKPVQICGQEHFINSYHKWTCSGAPIIDSSGKIWGSVDLTGYSCKVHTHTLGMVVSTVGAIGKMMEAQSRMIQIRESKKYVETLVESLSVGILIIDENFKILKKNKFIDSLFLKEFIIGDSIEYFFKNPKEILIRLQSEKIYNEKIISKDFRNNYYLNIHASSLSSKKYMFVFENKKDDFENLDSNLTLEDLKGNNKNFLELLYYAQNITKNQSTTLIFGENGSGKNTLARAIHRQSDRKFFLEIDEKNLQDKSVSLTQDLKNQGVTFFIDHIDEFPKSLQKEVLNFIEFLENENNSKIKLIVSTNKNLGLQVQLGSFRNDLYYRLNILPIQLIPLRDRKDDIKNLMIYFLEDIARKLNKKPIKLSEKIQNEFLNYHWPNNIKELKNAIIKLYSLKNNINNLRELLENKLNNVCNDDLTLEELEKIHIINVLKKNEGNITSAAKSLGIGRNTLYRKIEKYNL